MRSKYQENRCSPREMISRSLILKLCTNQVFEIIFKFEPHFIGRRKPD
jgi:hypothetical protein